MDTGIAEELPATLPAHFERRATVAPTGTWFTRADTSPVLAGRGFWEYWTSSSRLGTLENPSRMWLEAPSAMSSRTDLIEFLVGERVQTAPPDRLHMGATRGSLERRPSNIEQLGEGCGDSRAQPPAYRRDVVGPALCRSRLRRRERGGADRTGLGSLSFRGYKRRPVFERAPLHGSRCSQARACRVGVGLVR